MFRRTATETWTVMLLPAVRLVPALGRVIYVCAKQGIMKRAVESRRAPMPNIFIGIDLPPFVLYIFAQAQDLMWLETQSISDDGANLE